jgi:hypothetical protein
MNRNAADKEQIRQAKKKTKRDEDRLFSAIREVLSTASGRYVVRHFIHATETQAKPTFRADSGVYYTAALRDIADAQRALLEAVDPFIWIKLEQERIAQAQQDEREAESLRVRQRDKQPETEPDVDPGENA